MSAVDATDQPVRLSFAGGIATIVLDHPPLNLFDVEMRDGVIEAVSAVRDVPDARVLVVRSALVHSGAGADLSEFGGADSIMDARRIRWERDPWSVLVGLPIPTIAELRGLALGSAFELALLCDVRIATPDARMGLPEVRLGMLPAAGGTQSLTRVAGPVAAVDLIARAETVTAVDALRRGLVHVVAEDAAEVTDRVAHRLASLDPGAVTAMVRCLRASRDRPLHDGLQVERDLARVLRHRTNTPEEDR